MKSNVCKIEKGTKDLEAILNESERVAEYNGLEHKKCENHGTKYAPRKDTCLQYES